MLLVSFLSYIFIGGKQMDKLTVSHNIFKKLFKRIALLGIVTGMVFPLSACFLLPTEEVILAPPLKEPPKVTYKVYEVKKGTIERKVECRGTFVSVQQSDLSFKEQNGRLKKIYVNLGDAVKAGQVVAELDTENLSSSLKEQEIVYEKAKLAYDMAAASGDTKYAVQQAKLDLELQQLKLNEIKTGLQKAKLVSPISGIVAYKHIAKEGDNIEAYQTLVRVADPARLELQFSEDEYSRDKVYAFNLGMKVQVKINDKMYEGEVVMTPYNMPADADNDMRKMVRIKVANIPGDVKIGHAADIRLDLERKENVIVIPKSLVTTQVNKKYVQVLEDGIKKEKYIETGLETDTEVEVVKGLNVGEQIIDR
jgi:RND family efflux transporter MFP subunit